MCSANTNVNNNVNVNTPSQPQTPTQMPLKVAVLVSGNGSNLQVLIDAMQAGELPINIVGVISNVADAYAITRAKNANIDTAVLSHVNVTDEHGETISKRMGIKTFERHASNKLNEWQPDLIVLAGFMRVLSGNFIDNAPAPIINLHPSLLPKFKGLDTHQRAIDAGEQYHGCSVHVVTEELDDGQVLTQAVLTVEGLLGEKNNTSEVLQARVQKLEHKILPWTILLIARGVLPAAELKNQGFKSTSYLPALPLKLWLG